MDQKLTCAYLNTCSGKRRRAIKEWLLDQSIVAGIGNIHSDEILFTAGIYPARPANSLNTKEWEQLTAAILERISFFIDTNKITPEEYLETKGQDYRNTPYLQVYGQGGSPVRNAWKRSAVLQLAAGAACTALSAKRIDDLFMALPFRTSANPRH